MYGTMQKVAAIHDLSGFGRGSLTAVIPTLSAMGIQVCPLPTAILSNHTTGFDTYSYVDLTDSMEDFIRHWEQLHLHFDAVYSGFLGSTRQIDMVARFIDRFGGGDTLVAVDPVMGDDGELYSAFTGDIIPAMQTLIRRADLITPNFTEAGYLLGETLSPADFTDETARDWLRRLCGCGPRIAVITSAPDPRRPDFIRVVAHDRDANAFWKAGCRRIPADYPGTGDTFASVLIGALLQGESLPAALDRSVRFVSRCIQTSCGSGCPPREGILLERELGFLSTPGIISGCELL